ncbi:MAG: hypothetical protein HC866_09495 [Leptolyngbyaceae cyanobacterium RU_5_1]|nr:hypothetical protein [Leptolyngbyaceae cyanobacterium RU_5_1]
MHPDGLGGFDGFASKSPPFTQDLANLLRTEMNLAVLLQFLSQLFGVVPPWLLEALISVQTF